MKSRYQHFLFWIFYLFLESYLEFAWTSSAYPELNIFRRFFLAFSVETSYLIIKIPYAYLCYYAINNLNKNIWATSLMLFVNTFFFVFIHRYFTGYLILPYIYNQQVGPEVFDYIRYVNSFIDLIFIAGLLLGFNYYQINKRLKERQAELIKEKLSSELNLLKAQINPHFLFNTLNNIYQLTKKDPEKASSTVLHLSTLLRFMLYESKHQRILIEQEIEMLSNYIQLEKIRYSDDLIFDFSVEIEDDSKLITPLLFLPLIENAFKHGASEASNNAFIKIQLKQNKNTLFFNIENSVEEEIKDGTKIGLKNIQRQLQLSYREFSFKANNINNIYKVEVSINLDSYEEI